MGIELVTDPYACMMYIVSPLAGLGGAYCGGLPPTACFNADACTAMSEVGEQRLQSTVKLHLQFSCIMLPAKNRLRVRSENLRYPVSANNLAATGYPVSLHL